jgi:hypothetical protein
MASGPSVFGHVVVAGLEPFDPFGPPAECGAEGVHICLHGTEICTESDAAGQFVLGGLPAGIDATITFERAGDQPTLPNLRLAQIGSVPVNLRQVRIAPASERGSVFRGTGLTPDAAAGVVVAVPIAPGEAIGGFMIPEGVTITLMPGEHRPFYSKGAIGPDGLSSSELDRELTATRAGGWAMFLNVPPGAYTLRFEHNGVPCSQTLPGNGLGVDAQGNVRIEVVAGFTTGSTVALCL